MMKKRWIAMLLAICMLIPNISIFVRAENEKDIGNAKTFKNTALSANSIKNNMNSVILNDEETVVLREQNNENNSVIKNGETVENGAPSNKVAEDILQELAENLTIENDDAAYTLTYEVNQNRTVTITGYTGTASGELVIPGKIDGYDVSNIGNSAFNGCSGFTGNLVIPESVTSIGDYAFKDCNGFTGDLIIPDSVTSIGYDAFSGCKGFNGKLVISKNITIIKSWIFNGCSSLTGDLVIPGGVTEIGAGAFKRCSGLTGNLVIPEGVTSIGGDAFNGCSGFNGNLVIPKSTTLIYEFAFNGCNGFIGNLVIPENVRMIDNAAFSDCSGFTGNLIIPESVTLLGNTVFAGCSGLTGDLVIPESVTNIGTGTFYGCSGFNGDLVIPESIKNIGAVAFSGCSGLKNISLPEEVTSIGDRAFDKCSNLTDIYYGGSEQQWTLVSGREQIPDTVTIHYSSTVLDDHIVSLTPDNGKEYEILSGGEYIVVFDQNIKEIRDNCYAVLQEYNSGTVVKKCDLKQGNVLIRKNKLIFRFFEDKPEEILLSPNTKYCILIDREAVVLQDGSTSSGISSKDYWNFTTMPMEYEYPLITNNEAVISIDSKIYNILYEPLKAWLIRTTKKDPGTNGVCFGFSYTVGAWKDRYKAIHLIGSDVSALSDINLETKGKLNYTFHEYMQLAHIYQFSNSVSSEINHNIEWPWNSNKKISELYKLINDYIHDKGSPIIFSIYEKMGLGGAGHALLPCAIISEDNNCVRIMLYDCNGERAYSPYDGKCIGIDFSTELILKKSGDQFVGWECPKYPQYNGCSTFWEIDEVLDTVALMSNEEKKSPNLVVSQTEIEGLEAIVGTGEEIYLSQDESHYLYWTDDSTVTRIADENDASSQLALLGITDGHKMISSNASLKSDMTLDLKMHTVTLYCQDNSEYEIVYRNAENENTMQITTINGTASGEIKSVETDEGIILTGENLSNVNVLFENDPIGKKKVFSSSEKSVLITFNNNEIIVKEDADNDGIYEKNLEDSSNDNNGSDDNSNTEDGDNPGNKPNTGDGDNSGNKPNIGDDNNTGNRPDTGDGDNPENRPNTGNNAAKEQKQNTKENVDINLMGNSKQNILSYQLEFTDEGLKSDKTFNYMEQTPQTGDETDAIVWITLLMISILGLFIILKKHFKSKIFK